MSLFTEPKVCTITATASLNTRVNIVDTAKVAELGGDVLAIRLSYAGGRSSISKGIPAKKAKPTSARRSFNNQVTFLVRLKEDKDGHACCKVFHNGTVHITGARSEEDIDHALKTVWDVLCLIKGVDETIVNQDARDHCGILLGVDHILYSPSGMVLGWGSWLERIFYLNDFGFVDLEQINDRWVFVQGVWTRGVKSIYDLRGQQVGSKKMDFFPGAGRRYYTVIEDDIMIGSVPIGRIVTDLQSFKEYNDPCSLFQRSYAGVADTNAIASKFSIHMVNIYFRSSFHIDRLKLHQAFIKDGFYSRFDPCVNPGVNLRFYDNTGQKLFGVCQCTQHCNCKKVSVRCFTSGSLIVAGLRDIEHGNILHAFICKYYTENISRFSYAN